MGVVSARVARRGAAFVVALSLAPGLFAIPPAVLADGVTQSTTTLGAPALNPQPVGRTSDITATVTASATGSVKFYLDTVETATVAINGNQATWTIPAGLSMADHAIRAEYQGDSTYAKSEDTRTVTVGPRAVAVVVTLSGPHDASGATAQKGDVVTASVTVSDAGTTGSLAMAGGSVDVKVDGVVKGSFDLSSTWSLDLATSAWALGAHQVVAAYTPQVADTDHMAGSSPNAAITLGANAVDAVGYAASPTTFYPYRDGYRDTTKLRGFRKETASVTIRIYSSAGKLVRTLTAPSGIGAWSVPWDGRNASKARVAAGKYTIKQTVKDSLGLSRRLPSVYVTVSNKRLYTSTITLKKSTAARSAGSPAKGWVGWRFTLPSATVYKKLVFAAFGRSSVPPGVFGPHSFAVCPSTSTWNPGCMARSSNFPILPAWRSVTGSVTADRHGSTVRMYAVGGNATAVAYARVTVTYAVLK